MAHRKIRTVISLTMLLIVVLAGFVLLWPEKFYLPLRRLVRPSKTIIVPYDCKTVWQAVSRAEYGDTVFIKEGVYEAMFEFTGCLNIIGEGIDKTFIRSEYSTESVFKIYNCRGTKISNLTLEHTTKNNSTKKTGVMFVQNGFLDIENCRIRRADGYGIFIRQRGKVNIRNCIIEENTGSGILVWEKGVSVNIQNCKISNNGEYGICFDQGARGLVENNTFENNRLDAVKIEGTDTKVISKNNSFSKNVAAGLFRQLCKWS
jgi:parallel beta-helix repeat protein